MEMISSTLISVVSFAAFSIGQSMPTISEDNTNSYSEHHWSLSNNQSGSITSSIQKLYDIRPPLEEKNRLSWNDPTKLREDSITSAVIKVRSTLGINAADRVRSFLNYTHGWDSGRGTPLSLTSLEMMNRFLSRFDLKNKSVAVFMTDEGNAVINWPLLNGHLIEVEFYKNTVSVFVDGDDDEAFYSLNDNNLHSSLFL